MNGLCLSLAVVLFQVSWIAAKECDLRYYEHYQHKGCRPVIGEDGCPTRFQCDPVSDESRQKCLHNGKSYNIKEQIEQRCESCHCFGDKLEGAYIECASTDCPDWEAQDKSCYMGYKLDACCPTEMCPSGNEEQSKACSYNGKNYEIGQFIETGEPCKTCVCSEDWKGVDGPGCRKVNCLTGIYAPQIRKGCLPIYEEKTCCGTGIHCGDITGAKPVSPNAENTDDLCHYQEKYYIKGSTVFPVKNSGVECKCVVPPDFTCLRKRF